MEQKKNILWINALKAISIIGVFFVHSQLYYHYWMGNVNLFIHPFYVNAFFFVSGYLLFRKQLSEQHISQKVGNFIGGGYKSLTLNIIYRIAIPTVLFSAIEFVPSYMLRGKAFGFGTFLYKTIGGCTYWFTAALVVAELLIGLMLLTRRKNIWFYFICCCALAGLGWWTVTTNFNFIEGYGGFPWEWKHGLICLVFMGFGGLYWRFENSINKLMNKWVLGLMIVAYVALLSLWPKTFRVLISTLDINIAGIGISLLATLILIELCKQIRKADLLNFIGQNTIGFYFMSGALPIVLSMVVHRVIPETGLLGLAIVFLGSMTISYFAVKLFNRWLPWMWDLREIHL